MVADFRARATNLSETGVGRQHAARHASVALTVACVVRMCFVSPAINLQPGQLINPSSRHPSCLPLTAEATAILAEALQQRINTVLPVGSDPVEYEAWQAEQDGQQQEAAEEEEAHEAAVEEEAQAAEEQREAAAEEAQVGADVYAHQPDPVAEAVMQ